MDQYYMDEYNQYDEGKPPSVVITLILTIVVGGDFIKVFLNAIFRRSQTKNCPKTYLSKIRPQYRLKCVQNTSIVRSNTSKIYF